MRTVTVTCVHGLCSHCTVCACVCLPLSWSCYAHSAFRQLQPHQVFKSLTQSMTSWTAGLFRWASQWLPLTPVRGGSPRHTSCWIQNPRWTGPLSLSRDLFHTGDNNLADSQTQCKQWMKNTKKCYYVISWTVHTKHKHTHIHTRNSGWMISCPPSSFSPHLLLIALKQSWSLLCFSLFLRFDGLAKWKAATSF